MNRQILRLSIPNIISNITVPLLGMVDMAIVGRLGDEAMIGAMAIGVSIFNFIYWSFGFLRMGTSGFTAQAYGARNMQEMTANLTRSIIVAASVAGAILILQYPLGQAMLWIMGGSDKVNSLASEYFYARVWAAPATLSLYAIHGWFIGMQNSRLPMTISIFINIINISFSLLFVFGLKMGFVGVAWGTVVAQYSGLLLSVVLWLRYYGRLKKYFDLKYSMQIQAMLRFFSVNRDIFIRTACMVAVMTFFTHASASMGDILLAVNMLLLQLFTLFSYIMDGFAYSAESLIGKFEGAAATSSIKKYLRQLFKIGSLASLLFTLIYMFLWREILRLFTDNIEIIEAASGYMIWIVLVPALSFIPFLIDGALIGATKNVIMRKTVMFSAIVFFVSYYSLAPFLGNHALWISFLLFMVSRGLSQYIMLKPLGWF